MQSIFKEAIADKLLFVVKRITLAVERTSDILLPLQEVLHRVLKDVDNGKYDVLFR